uniref:CASP-like protein n=1 Tax=Arundo donax TaxID=35708 RepID=A0A0A8ZWH6_ARUDO
MSQFDQQQRAAVSSPLRIGEARVGQQQRAAAAAENGGAAVPADVAAVAAVGGRRVLSVALRLATAVLSLAAFLVMASARTSGWAGDYYGRHQQYRYAVAVNVIVCVYSITQSLGEICRLISPRFIFRIMSSNYFSLFLDQVLAYLLMSASSAAASRHDLWVSRFGTDAFNKKINSAVWLSFLAFLALAANSLISTANLFSTV